MRKDEKKTARKKGEEGYFERNTVGLNRGGDGKANAVFPDADAFTQVADTYFDESDRKDELYGEAGLCLYLSGHNTKGKSVTLETLRKWYDGESCPWLQDAVQMAYLRIQQQVESDPRYREKAMVTRGIFVQKQTRLGGYQDRVEQKTDATVRIIHGNTMDESDFK